MLARSIRGRAIAFVLAALILGFAPLVHAMCIGQTHNATSTHTMPDGSTMVMPEPSGAITLEAPTAFQSVLTGLPENAGELASPGGSFNELTLLGLIALSLAPACLALLGIRGARRVTRDSLQVAIRKVIAGCRPPPIFHRPTMVDSLSLGISRT
jgi:hypothetical protein